MSYVMTCQYTIAVQSGTKRYKAVQSGTKLI